MKRTVREFVDLFTNEYGNHWTKAAKKNEEFLSLIDKLSPIEGTFQERVLACIESPICPRGNRKTFKSINRGWGFCERRCECAKESALEKSKKTLMDRYGVDHQSKIDEVQERIRITNSLKTDEQKSSIQEKRRRTSLKKYGVDNASKSEEVKEKLRLTNRERYGVDYPLQNTEIFSSKQDTNILRYGAYSPSQAHIPDETLRILSNKKLLEDYCENRSLSTVAKELGVSYATIGRYCRDHDLPIRRSSYENEIAHFLTSHKVDFIQNDRSILCGQELDFYIPEHNLAIEFNGLYWHSSIFKTSSYHREKYESCRARGIRLLMIYEDEWRFRGDIIKSSILNILGKSVKGRGARKLSIAPINKKVANQFFDEHHIQGRTGSILYAMGAFEDELVGVMAFNHQRGTGDIELIRFCSDGKNRAGLFSRLFKHSVETFSFTDVISFADLRYSEGNVYEKNGFKLVSEHDPDYRYIINDRAVHKSSFTKAKIAKKYGIDVLGKTERQLMEGLDIPRIYDCGKLKYEWKS